MKTVDATIEGLLSAIYENVGRWDKSNPLWERFDGSSIPRTLEPVHNLWVEVPGGRKFEYHVRKRINSELRYLFRGFEDGLEELWTCIRESDIDIGKRGFEDGFSFPVYFHDGKSLTLKFFGRGYVVVN